MRRRWTMHLFCVFNKTAANQRSGGGPPLTDFSCMATALSRFSSRMSPQAEGCFGARRIMHHFCVPNKTAANQRSCGGPPSTDFSCMDSLRVSVQEVSAGRMAVWRSRWIMHHISCLYKNSRKSKVLRRTLLPDLSVHDPRAR